MSPGAARLPGRSYLYRDKLKGKNDSWCTTLKNKLKQEGNKWQKRNGIVYRAPVLEIREMLKEVRKGMPRIIDVHCHPYTKEGWRSLGKFRTYLETYLYAKKNVTPELVTQESPTDEEWLLPFRELGIVCIPTAWAASTTMAHLATLFTRTTPMTSWRV